jgi:DNA-binding transcriptional LysR family regulator
LNQFQEEAHLSVTTVGTGFESLEKAMESQHVRRTIGMRVPSFLGLTALLGVTDFVVIVPKRFGRVLAESGRLRLFPLPFPFPSYNVTQNWHERYTHDPAQQWFRNIIARIFREQSPPAAVPIRKGSRLRDSG